jgi:DNA (cytosine-5)-methyltransferase 1
VKKFVDLGYDVRWQQMEGCRFGLVQSKSRQVIVGGRDGILDALSIPVLPSSSQSLSATIGDLVAAGVQGDEHREAVESWLDLCKGAAAPAFRDAVDKYGVNPPWEKLRIDLRDFVKRPPTLKDLTASKGFKLNTDMVARIQGFPAGWNVKTTQQTGPDVAAAFPPPMARIIGLAIHSALEGIEFDYERALTAPYLSMVKKTGQPIRYIAMDVSSLASDPNRVFRERERRRLLGNPERLKRMELRRKLAARQRQRADNPS